MGKGFRAVLDNYDNYANLAAFPAVGDPEKLYSADDTEKLYRWDGGAYQEVGGAAGVPSTFDTVASAESASGVDNNLAYVVENESWYRYEADAAAFTRDGLYILNTGDAGNTRWLSIAGKYINDTINRKQQQFDISIAAPAHSEGLMYYDNSKKALSYFNDEAEVTLNIGQETYVRVRNETGSTITNGTPVYVSGESGGMLLVDLADAAQFNTSRVLGVVTHDIENNTNGYTTRFGEVGGLNTTGYSAGDQLYLSSTTPGTLTNVKPNGGSFISAIGTVKIVNATTGVIIICLSTDELSVETTDTNGFPFNQRTGTTLSFVNGTRTFTIAPTGSEFHFYENGEKYLKTSSEDIVIADTEGQHIIYYSLGVLTEIVNPTDAQYDDLIRNKPLISIVYWDATNSQRVYLADERHGISMSPDTHSYLHFTRGAQFLSGLALNNLDTNQSGALDAHAQFGVDSGFYTDEDLIVSSNAIASTTGLPIYYLDGAGANLRRLTNAGFSVLDDVTAGVGVTGRLVYNEFTGATWQLATVSNNDFVLCHVFAINGDDGTDQLVAFIGQDEYTTLGNARAGAETEISSLLLMIPIEETVAVGTIIFQTSNGYSNAVLARTRTTDTGDDYVDWRSTELQAGGAPTSHNNLANLELANTGVTYGHINDQAQEIYGVKTFNDNSVFEGTVGIGIATPDGTLHVHTSSAGAVTPAVQADDLVVESSGTTGISILSPDASTSRIYFGSPSDQAGGEINWNQSTGFFTIGSQTTGGQTRFQSGNGVEAARINADGNFGIGTTNPQTVLQTRKDIDTAYTVGQTTAVANSILRFQNFSDVNNQFISLNFFHRATGPAQSSITSIATSADNTEQAFIIENSGTITEAMRINSSANVGIGTSNPISAKFVVEDTAATGVTEIAHFSGYSTDENNIYVGKNLTSNNTGIIGFKFITDNNASNYTYLMNYGESPGDGLNIGDGGKVAIGTTSFVDGDFTVANTATTGIVKLAQFKSGSTGENNIYIGKEQTGNNTLVCGYKHVSDGSTSNYAYMMLFGETPGQGLNIADNGRIGIKTTNPQANLEIEDGGVPGSGGVIFKVTADDGDPWGLVIGNDTFSTSDDDGIAMFMSDGGIANIRANGTNSEMAFYTNGAARVRIDDGGFVGIGTTAPEGDLHIFESNSGMGTIGSGADNLIIESSGSTGITIGSGNASTGNIFFGDNGSTTIGRIRYNHSTNEMNFWTNNTEQMYITSVGGIYFPNLGGPSGAGSNARYSTTTDELFYETSSLRYKENIVDTDNSKWLYDLKLKNYDRIGQDFNEDGFIAEEVEKLTKAAKIQGVVFYNKKGEVEGYNKSDLVPYLINELQKHEKTINKLCEKLKVKKEKPKKNITYNIKNFFKGGKK